MRPARPEEGGWPGGDGPAPGPSAAPPGPGQRWTILRLVLWSAGYLKERGVEDARLDAEHLLAHALGVNRLQLYLQHERPLGAEELAAFKPLLRRRAAREPLQYILGRASFRELELVVDPRALIPRPETEVLVEVVLDWARRRAPVGSAALSAADVGTGSGAIALSLAVEGPFRRIVATDASPAALSLAEENLRVSAPPGHVELRHGALFQPLGGERFDALVSNPPYVSDAERESLAPEVRDFEPAEALFGGPDGLAVIRPLVGAAAEHLLPGGLLALEVASGHAGEVAGLVERTGDFEAPRVRRDLAARERVVTGIRKG